MTPSAPLPPPSGLARSPSSSRRTPPSGSPWWTTGESSVPQRHQCSALPADAERLPCPRGVPPARPRAAQGHSPLEALQRQLLDGHRRHPRGGGVAARIQRLGVRGVPCNRDRSQLRFISRSTSSRMSALASGLPPSASTKSSARFRSQLCWSGVRRTVTARSPDRRDKRASCPETFPVATPRFRTVAMAFLRLVAASSLLHTSYRGRPASLQPFAWRPLRGGRSARSS